jgi:nuclear-control-of-ATPase protein 2
LPSRLGVNSRLRVKALPERLVRFAQSFTSLLRSQNLSLYRLSSNWQAIKNLVSSSAPLLLTSIFPHLSQERYAVYLRWRWDPRNVLELTRQECFLRRKELEGLRDSKAKALGKLADLSHLVKLSTVWRGQNDQSETMQSIVTVLTAVLGGKSEPTGTERSRSRSRARFLSPREFCATIQLCISERLPRFAESHDSTLARLYRPSRLTRIWPKVVFYPIVGLIAARYAYRSKDSVVTIARDALDTVRGFWTGWVVEPVTGIIRTVRTGGEDGPRVISKDGLNSDMEVSGYLRFRVVTGRST